MGRGALAALGLLAGSVALPVRAGAEPVPLTLTEALDRAETQNPDLLAARARAEGQGARAEALRRTAWPRLSLASSWSRTDNPSYVFAHKLDAGEFSQPDFAVDRLNAPPALSHLGTALALEAAVDVSGRIRAAAQGQAAAGRAADAQVREAVQDLRLRTITAYREAFLALRAVTVTERSVEGARAREADLEARVAEGASLPADLLRVRSRRRQREADLAARRGEAQVAAALLTRLLGAEPGAFLRPVDPPPATAPLEGDEASWTVRALGQRAVLDAARRQAEAASWAARGEERQLLPDLGVFGQLRDDRVSFSEGSQSFAFGASVRWSVLDAARGRRTAAATAERRAAELEARAAVAQVRLEIERAFRRALSARERLTAAAGGAEEGREALRVVRERRQAGMATLTDELETEAAGLAAELDEARAETEVALADAALRRAAGEPR